MLGQNKMNNIQKNERIAELETQRADAINAVYDFSNYLSLPKFHNTDTQLNNYVQVSDVHNYLRLILDTLTK